MRTARLMGLSQDGQTLMVVTDTGEELAIAADDRLRAALRGDRPRLGQLEIEMDSALRPRDIQSRIRSGESLDDVARAAGIPLDRVERFAAPVLAERDHVARLAVAGSVRRRGETSGHRNLRVALTERLASRGVDVDDVEWDSYRLEDGRWAVAGIYRSGDSDREALFFYDLRGRFSVAGNDEARWVLGEHVAAAAATRRRAETGEPDTEPTVDLSDELALVRAVQEPVRAAADLLQGADPDVYQPEDRDTASANPTGETGVDDTSYDDTGYDQTGVSELFNDADLPGAVRLETAPTSDGPALTEPEELELPLDAVDAPPVADGGDETEDETSELRDLESGGTASTPGVGSEISHQTWEEEVEESLEEEAIAEHSQLDTLYGMLSDDQQSEESPRTHSGLSDASAIPETDNAGWEPAIMVDYPVEPSVSEDETDTATELPAPEASATETPVTETPVTETPVTEILVPNDPSDLLSNADAPDASTPHEPEASAPREPDVADQHETAEPAARPVAEPPVATPTAQPAAEPGERQTPVARKPSNPTAQPISESGAKQPAEPSAQPTAGPPVRDAQPAAGTVQREPQPTQDEESQPALVPEPASGSEGDGGPAPAKKSTKRKRASVPSWDEIMFGGPKRT